jgi:hypothetical protein
MKAVDDLIFDSGFGTNESYNGGISLGILNQIGGAGLSNSIGSIDNSIYNQYGGGGGTINVGGGSEVLLTNQPNTSLSNESYNFVIKSTQGSANIIVNGEDTQNIAPTTLNFNTSDILLNGGKTITLKKNGYKTLDSYVISLVKNPNHRDDYQQYYGNFNPASSILGGMGGNVGFSGLSMFPTFNQQSPIYSDTKFYKISIKKYSNGFEQSYENNFDSNSKELNFELEKIVVQETPVANNLTTTVINLNGSDNSVILFVTKVDGSTQQIKLTKGNNELSFEVGSSINIYTSDISKYRLTNINVSAEGYDSKTISAQLADESVSTNLKLTAELYSIQIDSQVYSLKVANTPSISFLSNDKIVYNINSKADVPIGLMKSDTTTAVRLYVNNQTFTFDKLDTLGTTHVVSVIPSRVFQKIGAYKVILVPTNADGDGDSIDLSINVVDDVYVGVPDIRNIQYPSILRGPDFVGTNVDFTISYESVNTDYVRIYKLGSNQFLKETKAGIVNLNFQTLLDLDGVSIPENQDIINLTLKLVPYNESGRQIVVGKEELIDIKFDKGDLTIPRDVAVSRIADGFISQFDTSIFEDETSKYLTHLLHLGDGDNKVITTWVGSENSLILKLYEPIPTSVQPNQQVWISKLQSQPIVETITISGTSEIYCHPLKGPNFSLDQSNGIAYQVFDDLIASGSVTSNDLINNYLSTNGIDTTTLNINYVSGSTYVFDNFVHFSSAEERINNFFYKVQLIESYKTKYEALISKTFIPPYGGFDGGLLTQDGYQTITEDGLFDIQWEIAQFSGVAQAGEAKKVLDTLTGLIRGLDGYENFLYKSTNDLAYPKKLYIHPISGLATYILKPTSDNDVIAWYESLVGLSYEYDKYNPNYLINNIPEFIKEDYNNNDFFLFLDMIGQHFDILWAYIANLSKTKILEHKQVKGFSNKLVHTLLESFGWDAKRAFNSELLWEYAFGTDKDGFQKYGMPLADANDEVWRRILNNLPYLLKHKGTGRAMKAVMACYGVPQSMLTIMEFGGPQDPSGAGTSKFTFDDRTAAIYLSGSLNSNGSSNIKVPWKYNTGSLSYPDCVEFRILPAKLPNTKYSLISGSEWSLDLIQTTGSFGKIELNFGGDIATNTYFSESINDITSYYISYINNEPYAYGPDLKTGSIEFPISTQYYSQVAINRHNNPDSSSWFEVWLNTTDGHRIVTSVSMSISTPDSQWETGETLQIGGNGYEGTLDEVRLWTVPLQRSKFENHTLFPDATNGNDYDSSTKDLLFRLDFERPKDRTKTENNGIINVSISDNYGEQYGYINNMYSASRYPYQYIPYDRTVTANVPSLGLTYSNKIRFEEQTLVSDLSYKQRATKKSFDRAPIDTNRLGLFFSPIKELNMDILKTFGDFNIDNYIGNPADEYKDHYSELDTLRHYYFERMDGRDIYEYIRLVKYIDKSLFEVLADLAPARTNISKGLLIEPHYLERSKTKWQSPIAEHEDYNTLINYDKQFLLQSEAISEDANIDAKEVTTLVSDISNEEGIIDAKEVYYLDATNTNYDTLIDAHDATKFEGTVPMYDAFLQAAYTGSNIVAEAEAFSFESIGMEKDSLANLGYGLYATNGTAIVRNLDTLFGNYQSTGSRKSVFLVKEKYTQKISTQVAGYPVNGALPGSQVRYADVSVTKYKYKVSSQPWSGSVSVGNNVVSVESINGYLPTHYRYVNNLSEGMNRSFWKGSQQTVATTPDGLNPVETFTTNPNILRVAKTGRGSGEPILEVD